MAAREQNASKAGKRPGGKPPTPPTAGPRPSGQTNLTDDESCIMKAAGGFAQYYNAQVVTDTESILILEAQVTQAANDKEQVVAMVKKLRADPEGLNAPEHLLADTDYFSEKNVDACAKAKITPPIAVKREAPSGLARVFHRA